MVKSKVNAAVNEQCAVMKWKNNIPADDVKGGWISSEHTGQSQTLEFLLQFELLTLSSKQYR